MELLNICHSVVYPDDESEETYISLIVISKMNVNIVDIYNSKFQHENFVLPWRVIIPHWTQLQLILL